MFYNVHSMLVKQDCDCNIIFLLQRMEQKQHGGKLLEINLNW
jgi:hypothetical protein